MATVGILGAGISGLAAAYRLKMRGLDVRVLEASSRAGGVIQSDRESGFLVERGPNSIRAGSAQIEHLIDELDLENERIWANDVVSTRYVVRDGRPAALPSSLGDFLSTDLFSARTKLGLLAEPFVGRAETDDESVAAFTRRRLGREILDYAVAPFVGGVFAGAPDDLSLRHVFPRLAALERKHGSLFVGAVKKTLRRESNGQPDVPSGLFSFRKGLQTLPDALARELEEHLLYQAQVSGIGYDGQRWQVDIRDSRDQRDALAFDALISTIPLHRLRDVEFETPVDLNPLWDVAYPPLSVLALGYPREAVSHPLDGFGLLVPPAEENFDILGTIFSSTIFTDRAPEGHVLLNTFAGGARNPEISGLDTDALQAVVERDLDRLFGVSGAPSFRRRIYWPQAIPQYRQGYGRVKETLGQLERTHPRLALAGNYRQGVSVPDALESGADAADRVAEQLDKTSE